VFSDPITGLVRRIREIAVRGNGMLEYLTLSLLDVSFTYSASLLFIHLLSFFSLLSTTSVLDFTCKTFSF
jgi:hypothetical protein